MKPVQFSPAINGCWPWSLTPPAIRQGRAPLSQDRGKGHFLPSDGRGGKELYIRSAKYEGHWILPVISLESGPSIARLQRGCLRMTEATMHYDALLRSMVLQGGALGTNAIRLEIYFVN